MLRSPNTSGQPDRLAILALIVLGLMAYVNCLSSEFIFDDLLFINGRTLDCRSLSWLAPNSDLPIKGRPLVGLSFVANYSVCGTQPAGYHLFNMLVHLGCALTLFGAIRRAMLRLDSASGNNSATGFAFACASLWMIHPLQTECVNYVSQRTESMATLFILASLYCAIRLHETSNRGIWLVAAGAASWAGVFCKEIAAVGPLLIVLFDFTFAECSIRDNWRDRWRLYATTFSCWIPQASLLYFLPRTITVGASGGVTVLQYALNQGMLIVQYLRLAFWPDSLVIDYGRPGSVTWSESLPAGIAVLSLFVLTLAIYRRLPAVGYVSLSGFLLLAPTSSFLPINSEVGAERRMYLPLAAIAILVVLGVREIVRRCCVMYQRHRGSASTEQASRAKQVRAQPIVHGVMLTIVVLLLGVRTVDRNGDFADPLKLWAQAVAANPENPRAWTWLACEFSRVDPATAERVSAEMASRWQDDWSVQFDVGETYLCLHRNAAAATRCYRRVVELDPSHARAQLRLVWLLAGYIEDDLRNGNEALEIALELQAKYPYSPETLDALAIAQAECGEFEAAIATAEAAIATAEAAGASTVAFRQRVERYRQGQPFRFKQT